VTVRRVPPDVVLPLRHAVLRTGRRWADAIYAADSDPLSAHFAAISQLDATVLAVGSVLPEAPDWDESSPQEVAGPTWRARGMAARAGSRGAGLGTLVLRGLLDHVTSQGGGLVWCTARLLAVSLYERAGLRARGEPTVVPGLGPHQVMWGIVPTSSVGPIGGAVPICGSPSDRTEPPTVPASQE
jgi:GNAT superfamily N-acetyltransferase